MRDGDLHPVTRDACLGEHLFRLALEFMGVA